jgi:predicted P-loop ATPase
MTVPKKLTVIVGGGSPPGGGQTGADDWQNKLTCTKDGAVQAAMHNLMLILEMDPQLAGLLALDEFANRVVVRRAPPWSGGNDGEFTELDGVELSAWLGSPDRYQMIVKSSMVLEAVEAVARRHKFHPVRDYLRTLKWDGEPRLRRLFVDHFGATDDEYHQRVAEIFMVSAAARILRPGCKVDTMLVLEGGQGLGKTRVTQVLFGGDRWYMDAQRSPAEKDFYQDIVGKWGVEIGEMTSFSKAETNKVKQTLSATSDTYRPSYGRYSRTFPRQCVFIGTTNENEWQRDHTGGRRFLPVGVTRVDVSAIEAVRDQLWAEAVALLDDGLDWWVLPSDAKDQQDERYLEDSWSEPISRWLDGRAPSSDKVDVYAGIEMCQNPYIVTECSTTEILTRALHIDLARHTKQDQMRVAAIMTRLAWDKYRPQRYGTRVWLWLRTGPYRGGDAPA